LAKNKGRFSFSSKINLKGFPKESGKEPPSKSLTGICSKTLKPSTIL